MALQTSIANAMDHAGDAAKMDEYAKKIFSHESVLAPLMRMCIPEFAGLTDQYIIQNCFVEAPKISAYAVHQDENDLLDGNIQVEQMNVEDSSKNEETISYDIRFRAKAPGSGQLIYLIINVEIQAIDKKKYKVVTRGIYYCARMISRQYGTVFTKSNYQDIQKVYSIWICPESHRKQNSITAYRVNEELILGDASEDRQDYDKLQVIIITLDKDGIESENPLVRFLSLLLAHELPVESRKSTLEEEYKIQIDENLTEEMSEMCNIGEAVARKNLQQGISQGILQGVPLGEDRLARLINQLSSSGRVNDALRVAADPVYREEQYKAFKMDQETYTPA